MALRLHQVLISIVMISLIFTGFLLFLNSGASVYSPADYDNSSLSQLSEALSDINATANEAYNQTQQIQGGGFTDILGGIFFSAYNALRTTFSSISTMFVLVTASLTGLPIGTMANTLISGFSAIIIIAVIIGIFGHILTKSDRT